MKKVCKYCGKELKRNKRKVKPSLAKRCPNLARRGWIWEDLTEMAKRDFCDFKCSNKFKNKMIGNVIWTKELITREFMKIDDERKYNNGWFRQNYSGLNSAIFRHFGIGKAKSRGVKRLSWHFFMDSLNKEQLRNHWFTRKRKIASAINKYLIEEHDLKKGKVFEYSSYWGLPINGYDDINQRYIQTGIEYLVKNKKWRLFKRGRKEHYMTANKYIMIETRI
jgi:hypothetical protein